MGKIDMFTGKARHLLSRIDGYGFFAGIAFVGLFNAIIKWLLPNAPEWVVAIILFPIFLMVASKKYFQHYF